MSQLALVAEEVGIIAREKSRELCRCGHEGAHHDRRMLGPCVYGRTGMHGGCDCKKFRARRRLRVVEHGKFNAPPGAIVLKRPDTRRPKTMGWAIVVDKRVTIYLEQLKTKSPNKVTAQLYAMRFASSRFSPSQIIAMQKAADAKRCEWAMSALEQCHVEGRGQPMAIVVTRVSRGKLDRDNLIASCKFVCDGIAEGLLLDDKLFGAQIFVEYRQASPGKAGVFGVQIEVCW